jgi:hypothetical protein
MEIVVTAPTPMVQSPVSEEEEDNQSFGREEENNQSFGREEEAVEKGEQEEMEKSTKETIEIVKIEDEKSSEEELAPEKSTNNGEIDLNDVDLILKREHFVERRSSSSSDSEFSLGPRAAVKLPTPAGTTAKTTPFQ